jgi:hypothetical protein
MKTSFWFSALSSFIGVALGLAAAAAMGRGSVIKSRSQPGASIWDVC